MNSMELNERLQRVASSNNTEEASAQLTAELSRSPMSIDSVEPILRFMEENYGLDFGSPGPLVHFVERFCGKGYEEKLLESVSRKPTSHTIWMLNRLINGSKVQHERTRFVQVLKNTLGHPLADPNAKQSAREFLERLSS